MKVGVLMMFRDEIDILEKCLLHWKSMGVENFYLCDNGSVDGSDDIGSKYGTVFITDFRTNWPGRDIINKLKIIALKDGCDWLFPADADEFIQIPSCFNIAYANPIEQWLKSYNVDRAWGELKYLNILPSGKSDWQEPHRKIFGKSLHDWNISMGNHLIEGIPPTLDSKGVYYNHYSLRTFEQFKKKMINYMTAFHQTQYQDHPHAKDYHEWQKRGDDFLQERWTSLINF